MKAIIANLLLATSLLIATNIAQAQVCIGYHPFNSIFWLSSNTAHTLRIESRFQTNSFLSSLNTEIAPMFTVKRLPHIQYYIGGGANFGIVGKLIDNATLVKGYFLSAGIQLQPFEKQPNLSVVFEMSPYSATDFKSGVFRTWLGISYQFQQKNDL